MEVTEKIMNYNSNMKKVGKVLPSQLYWCIYWCMQQFLNWKEETSTKFSLYYTKSFLCLCLLHWKKKKHFRIPLCVSQHICDKLNTKYLICQSFSQHPDKRNKENTIFLSKLQQVNLNTTTASYKKKKIYFLYSLFTQHLNKRYKKKI